MMMAFIRGMSARSLEAAARLTATKYLREYTHTKRVSAERPPNVARRSPPSVELV